ncbi:hypothetical protein GYMLUDRAFT_73545 [Collybiopsis luxurians FD-317 M1]|uniref:Aminotransferase class I/classII large domain-containing protein n=1 Tax=Collybiopsis luxurians FD-317 M1 TaxID=944289 RepID=A0A0D0CEZ0_9AGAR|nr:hypothetical protein GYMLUDRAFT_73545 [Collybiopsis luxurians FD-317 M1]
MWGPDFFSNDYLGLSSDPRLRELFLERLSQEPFVMGSSGSRLLSGNTPAHVEFESRMMSFFNVPAALLCNSGYDANTAFFGAIPQQGDVIVYDELVHASIMDGIASSRARGALYPFEHNSVDSLQRILLRVVQDHPVVQEGRQTVFIAVESLYSMDGDFSPLPDIVTIVNKTIPKISRHIVVDEAHTSGLCGVQGRGYVSLLGLESHIQTVIHTFGKARACAGAVILTSPTVRRYLINYGRPFIYSTSLPYFAVMALNATFEFRSSSLAQRLQENIRYFSTQFFEKTRSLQPGIVSIPKQPSQRGIPSDLFSPIFPILTPASGLLAEHLRSLGYSAQEIPYPVVPKGQDRIRVTIHSGNTRGEMDELIERIARWARDYGSQQLRANL